MFVYLRLEKLIRMRIFFLLPLQFLLCSNNLKDWQCKCKMKQMVSCHINSEQSILNLECFSLKKTAKGVLCNIHNEKNRGRVLQMKIKSAASLNLRWLLSSAFSSPSFLFRSDYVNGTRHKSLKMSASFWSRFSVGWCLN